jgi:multicomponent Na+:H+ antiporter subunit B
MREQVVLRVATKILTPPILLFALYVQFHGDLSPGGGFQGGVIFAAAFILYALVFGLGNARRVLPLGLLRVLCALGVLIYAGTGVVALLRGGRFLDYDTLRQSPVNGQQWGIFWVETGVFITVFSVMTTLFFIFAGRRASE